MSEWRKIDTAPKDGTWFLACRADEGEESYEIGFYSPMHWPHYVEAGDGLYRKEESVINEWSGFNNMHRMTHWQPLPEPPSTGGSE